MMKSHIKLFNTVLQEAGQHCGVDTTRDQLTVTRRLSKEGESFLTISLPAYEKGLLRALDVGRISSDLFPGFQATGGLPRLFSGFLRKIFDSNGTIRGTTPELISALRSLRQVLLFLSKIELECSPAREDLAIQTFRTTDAEIDPTPFTDEVSRSLTRREINLREGLQYAFSAAFGSYLGDIELHLRNEAFFRGNHGPGAVADHTGNNARWDVNQWTDRLESILPAESSLACNLHDYMDGSFVWLSEEQEPPVRVVTVPKTMKGPRVIAIEPVHMQYVQQGLFSLMSEFLEKPAHSGVKSTMGWLDQEPNRSLSRDWVNYSTIDLSEASDRVPYALVELLFSRWPLLWQAIDASRSKRAKLPSGEVITLRKFASMGSALCFPVESMVFTACAVVAKWLTEERDLLNPTYQTVAGVFSLPFRVFGDDIIVPREWTPNLLEVLSFCGLKVNTHKSFWTGMFRESCGADWYDHHDVSVVKIRSTITPNRQDVSSVVRGISLHNRFMELGWWRSAKAVEDMLLAVRPMFYAPYKADVLALWTFEQDKIQYKMDRNLHKVAVKAFSLSYIYKEDRLDGYGALRKYFLKSAETLATRWDIDLLRAVKSHNDPDHLLRSGRPVHVAMTVRYVSLPY